MLVCTSQAPIGGQPSHMMWCYNIIFIAQGISVKYVQQYAKFVWEETDCTWLILFTNVSLSKTERVAYPNFIKI